MKLSKPTTSAHGGVEQTSSTKPLGKKPKPRGGDGTPSPLAPPASSSGHSAVGKGRGGDTHTSNTLPVPEEFGCKLFIEGLPYDLQDGMERELIQLCQARKVTGIIRLVKKKGYGFGYLIFQRSQLAQKALTLLSNPAEELRFRGRFLRVERPTPLADDSKKRARKGDPATGEEPLYSRQLLLLDLPRGVNDEILDNVLEDALTKETYKAIQSIRLTRNRKAFVDFVRASDMQAVLECFQKEPFHVMGHPVSVQRPYAPGEYLRQVLRKEMCEEEENDKKEQKQGIATMPVEGGALASAQELPLSDFAMDLDNDDGDSATKPTVSSSSPPPPTVTTAAASAAKHTPRPYPTRCALIGGLAVATQSSEVQEYLEEHGIAPERVQLIVSALTKQPTGIARVVFPRAEDVQQAIRILTGKRPRWAGGTPLVIEEDHSTVAQRVLLPQRHPAQSHAQRNKQGTGASPTPRDVPKRRREESPTKTEARGAKQASFGSRLRPKKHDTKAVVVRTAESIEESRKRRTLHKSLRKQQKNAQRKKSKPISSVNTV